MKKNFFIYFLLLILTLSTIGCENKNSEQTYLEAIRKHDFEEAHKILDALYLDFEEVWANDYPKITPYTEELLGNIEVAAMKWSKAVERVYLAEARYLISERSIDEACSRLQFLLNEFIIIGRKIPVKQYVNGISTKDKQYKIKYLCHQLSSEAKNNLCNLIIDFGINLGNKKLIDIALMHYMENGIVDENGYVNYEYKDKNTALKKIKDAEKLGVFK